MAKAKKLPSGSWRILVYDGLDSDGKRKYLSFTASTEKEANYLALEYQTGRKQVQVPNNLTLTEAIDHYIENKYNLLSPSTILGYRTMQKNVFPELIKLPLNSITENRIQKQMNHNAKKYSAKSIHNQFGLLTAVLKKYKIKLDFDEITLKPKEKIFILIPTDDEIRRIIEIVKDTKIEIPILLAALAGLRRSEIAACEWDRLDGNILTVQGAIVFNEFGKLVEKRLNKSYSGTRKIVLVDYLVQRLNTLKGEGKMLTIRPDSILKIFNKLCIRNNLPKFTLHSLRHYHASVMLRLNVPDKYAMEMMGQNSPHVLKHVYQHTFSDKFIEINRRLNEHYKILDATQNATREK